MMGDNIKMPEFAGFSNPRHLIFLGVRLFCLFASGMVDECAYLLVEGILTEQTFKRDVHAIAPVVARIGRHVDTFVLRVGEPKLLVHAQPVLQGEDGKE